jgi:hypothetical protein
MIGKKKYKFGEHITVSYGLSEYKAYFICYNRLDKGKSWAYFPCWEDVESVVNASIKKGWKRSWKK